MSDFLGRLTARHAESAAPAVTPRAVSRFEASPLPIHHDVVEAVHTAEPRSSTARVTELPATPRERRESPVQSPAIEQPAVAERSEVKPVERAVPTRTRIEQVLKEVETIVRTNPAAEPRREVVREQQIVATPVIPRVVQAREVPHATPARTTFDHVAASENEPTVIRVHIGRIDVRATTPATDRPRPRAKPADAAQPMSLDRYLSEKDRT